MPELFLDPKTKIYHVKFRGLHGMESRSTGEKNKRLAAEIVKQARVAEQELAAKAGALSAATLQAIMAGRKVSCEIAMAEWEAWRQGQAEPNTVRTHTVCINQWFNRLESKAWAVTRLTFDQADEFVNGPEDVGAGTRFTRLAALKSFFRFCAARAYRADNPADLLRVKLNQLTVEQKEHAVRVPITPREYRHIMANTSGFWRCATALAYWTGLRLSDICCLEWSSILANEVVVWTRKGESRVALPLNHALIGGGDLFPVLMEIMTDRRDATYAFPEQRREYLDVKKRAKFSMYYGRILTRLGIEGKSFHCLRHAFATRLDEAKVSITDIGRLMGHAEGNEKVTAGYIHKGKRSA